MENTEYDWFENATFRNKKSGYAIETVKLFGRRNSMRLSNPK